MAYVQEHLLAKPPADPAKLTDHMRACLQHSEALIEELQSADVILLGAPVYNFGMPAQLKAYFDQVVRVGRTFSFDLARGDFPLEPILSGKTPASRKMAASSSRSATPKTAARQRKAG